MGGGLAGSFLAAECLMKGFEVTLVDEPRPDSPSRIAAGLFNVVTGREANLTWKAEELLGCLQAFFKQPAFVSLNKYYHPVSIYRPYKDIAERNNWLFKSHSLECQHLVNHCPDARFPDQFHNDLGGLEIRPCGWVEVVPLLREMKKLMLKMGKFKLVEEKFDYTDLDPEKLEVEGLGKFDAVVFAEGPSVKNNPWFSWLDVRLLKGQVLDIEVQDFPADFVLLRKVLFVDRGAGRYIVGATYEKNFSDLKPTQEGIHSLTEYIRKAIKIPFEVLGARAGVRPTSPNRRPILGQHPDFQGLFILNGMGSKGVLQAPWCARLMGKILQEPDLILPKELGLDRFR